MQMEKMRMWLKACPKCRGDLYSAQGHEGDYLECLQCGKVLYGIDQQIARLRDLRKLGVVSTVGPTRPRAYRAA